MPVLDTAPVSVKTSSQASDLAPAKPDQADSEQASKTFDQQLEAEIKRTSTKNEPASAGSGDVESGEEKKAEADIAEVDVQLQLVEQEFLPQSVLMPQSEEEIPDLPEGNTLPLENSETVILPATINSPQQGERDKVRLEQTTVSTQRQAQPQTLTPIQNLQSVVDPSVTEEPAFKEADFAEVLAQPGAKKPEAAVVQVENSVSRELPELSRSVRGLPVQMTAHNLVNETSTKEFTSQLYQQLQLNTPVTQKSWGQEFSQRISMLITNGQQQVAELQLNPARMGSISVRVSLDEEVANISFVTTQTAVKEAIEVSLPRLKEQLEQQGLDLGHVDVSSKDAEQASEEDAGKQMMMASDDDETEMMQSEELNLSYQQSDGVSVFV